MLFRRVMQSLHHDILLAMMGQEFMVRIEDTAVLQLFKL
jgi:hypothetical protein